MGTIAENQLTDEIYPISDAVKVKAIPDDRSSQSSRDDTQANVDNPLALHSYSSLEQVVSQFADGEDGLHQHLRTLQRGAQLARDKLYALDNDKDLEEEQKDYLRNGEECAGFFEQSKFLKGSILSACLAGIIQGWTQSAINGANIGMPVDFGLHINPNDLNRNTGDLWVFGTLSAIPFFAGGLLVPFVADPLQEHYLGRRGAIAVACLISIAGTIGQSFSRTPAELAGCRVVTGLALAAKASTAPLLTSEVSPNHLRGNLLSTWQLSDAFGIFLGFASNLVVLNISAPEQVVWRIQTATVLIPITALLIIVYLMPESPRFLMKHGRYQKALESFTFVRPSPLSALIAARDFIYAHFQLEIESRLMEERRNTKHPKMEQFDLRARLEHVTSALSGNEKDPEISTGSTRELSSYHILRTSYWQRLGQTLQDTRSRRALVCAATAMIAQQLTGINTLAFLSARLLNDVSASNQVGAWVGFSLGLCNFLFGAPSFWLLDRVGRASMLLIGFVPMSALMLILAFCFELGAENGARLPLIGIFGVLFIIAYSPTAGPSPFAISAEVFPLVVREVGHSIAVAVNFLGLAFVLLIFPFLSDKIGKTASLSLFAALNLVAFVLCFLFVPETKGRTLEELQFTFDLPTTRHIEYRMYYVRPWLVKKYVLPWLVKLRLCREPNEPVSDLVPFHRWARKER